MGSLSADIPYPPSSSKRNPSADDHPSNHFIHAFAAGQATAITRIGLGSDWPLTELWADKILPLRKVIDDFMQPHVDDACRKWKATGRSKENVDRKDDTLLEHYVTQTEGKIYPHISPIATNRSDGLIDISIIKDEVRIIGKL